MVVDDEDRIISLVQSYLEQEGFRVVSAGDGREALFVARQESEQKDDNIRNRTWRFGFSALNIFKSGFTVYGNYAANRGEISESDSYYVSLAKNFGRISWSVSFTTRLTDYDLFQVLLCPR